MGLLDSLAPSKGVLLPLLAQSGHSFNYPDQIILHKNKYGHQDTTSLPHYIFKISHRTLSSSNSCCFEGVRCCDGAYK